MMNLIQMHLSMFAMELMKENVLKQMKSFKIELEDHIRELNRVIQIMQNKKLKMQSLGNQIIPISKVYEQTSIFILDKKIKNRISILYRKYI